jgi:ABC-type multidrug transport system ATPase subunit
MELNQALFNISQDDLGEVMVELEKQGHVFNRAEKEVAYCVSQFNLYIHNRVVECHFRYMARYKNPNNDFFNDREDLEKYLKSLCVAHFKNTEPKLNVFEKIYKFIKNKISQ